MMFDKLKFVEGFRRSTHSDATRDFSLSDAPQSAH